ncbi:ABC transporter permease [Flavobacterium sp. LC2016-01]|uniref:ABC transporter permease n=1 Tax=Flavobacterium sp. LC2016-01 TaxID=2675876 RepID=UPI0012BAEC57|nr:ABC transporter permease [Flavobacterium sp. LC2016-01]MTH17370.1 FtsX-like permease family protein [Flavobacterium sp. LC2016-01]
MLKNWINIFIYQLKNNKLFTALNVLGLSIGISGLIFALLYWNDEKSYDSWNPQKDNVYQVLVQLKDMTSWSNCALFLKPALDADPNIETIMYGDDWYQKNKIIYKGKKEFVDKIINVQHNFFSFFPFEIIKGDAISSIKDDSSIAISDNIAKRVFGNENPIGKQIKCFDQLFSVRAVYRVPGNSSITPNVIINKMDKLVNSTIINPFVFKLLLKVKDPSKVENTRKKLERIYNYDFIKRLAKEEGFTFEDMGKKVGYFNVVIEPLSQARLHSITDGYPEGRGNYQFLIIMMGLSILILILSIINYINLATANAVKRAKEVGVRKITGASKRNIICQFIFETILTTSFSILLALVIVEMTLPYYNNFLNKDLILLGNQFYWQLLLIFIITVFTAGLFPAIYVANFETLKVLKGNFGRSKNGIWLRNVMLIFQFAIAAFFIIGSYIVYEQIQYLQNKDLGFKGNQVISVALNFPSSEYEGENTEKNIYSKYSVIKDQLSKIKGVEEISTGLISFDGSDNFISPVLYKNELFKERTIALDYGMFEMLNIKIAKGRNFDRKLASDTINSVIINESALKLMNIKNPIGAELVIRNQKLKIIGIVKDFNLLSPELKVPPISFYHLKTFGMAHNINKVFIKLKLDDSGKTIDDIEKLWSKVDTEYPFKYDFVDKEYARTYESYVKQKNLFSLLNIVVILIALFGLFALASYSIQRRLKEIAIRKTLGAETNALLKELTKQYVVYCVIGFLIGIIPAYLLLQKWLTNFVFRIDITILPFAIAFVSLLILTLIIVLTKAYQVTKVDVLRYLKYE